jgi:hypothetical protein
MRPFRWAALGAALALTSAGISAAAVSATATAATSFPQYDHVFLILDENLSYSQVIGNPDAPDINALASDYGIASHYTGVGDPSEPNYVGMLGGSTFGISDDNPYFWPDHTVSQPNLLSQLEAAGKTWRGYLQGIPYAGYRGYCYPAKCLGIPDADSLYRAKHNGIVNFADMQTAAEFANQVPYTQLATDLASGNVPNFSYIVPDECHDIHGAPPFCTDSGKAGSVDQQWLIANGDALVGNVVNEITSSPVWETGNNAIVVTSDEGNNPNQTIATVVVTNHGPRGVKDSSSYDHYSLLASLEDSFGLGCLQNACTANPMTPLFQVTGSTTVPTLPAPFTPAPNGNNSISAPGSPVKGSKTSLSCSSGWQQVPSPSIGSLDNNLAGVSAASSTDAWAVGDYYSANNPNVLLNMAEHWDGSTWSEYPLPNVGANQNTLLGVSELPTGNTWAVGYDLDANWVDQTLVEHWNGTSWSVVPSPSPGAGGNILYGVAALADNDVWAVGLQLDANGTTHALAEHWNGASWSVVPTVDPNGGGNALYALDAVSSTSVYAVGQTGAAFPSHALIEHWDGTKWSQLSSPADTTESLTTLGVTGSDNSLTIVGNRESDTTPYTTEVAAGSPSSLSLVNSPNVGAGENDLFSATTAADGSVYAAGWYVDPASGNYYSLIEHEAGGVWSVDTTPNPGTGANGFAGVAAIPGGGLWAVGNYSNSGSNGTFIAYHC